MAIKRRNKIKLPIIDLEGEDDEDAIEVKHKVPTRKPDNLQLLANAEEEEDEEDDLTPAPIYLKRTKLKSKTKTPLLYTNKEDDEKKADIAYSDELLNFKKNKVTNVETKKLTTKKNSESKYVVMNIEDLQEADNIHFNQEDDEDDENSSYPTKEEIKKIKQQRRTPQSGSLKNRRRIRQDEKDYVKLLDNDDKLEIMDSIKANGGISRLNEKEIDDGTALINEFEDERLALSNNEIQRQHELRKHEIENAINDVDKGFDIDMLDKDKNEDEEEWEARILNKAQGNANISNKINMKPKLELPELFKFKVGEKDNELSMSDLLDQDKLQSHRISLQLKTLETNQEELQVRKKKLIDQLINLSI